MFLDEEFWSLTVAFGRFPCSEMVNLFSAPSSSTLSPALVLLSEDFERVSHGIILHINIKCRLLIPWGITATFVIT